MHNSASKGEEKQIASKSRSRRKLLGLVFGCTDGCRCDEVKENGEEEK